MRKTFAKLTFDLMKENKDVYFLTADLGYKIFDDLFSTFPDRTFNTGAAEQLMVGAAVGLALEKKIPICYSITPFLLYRPFEIIRNYINYEKIPVKLVGSGRGKDYSHDGFSHWAEDDHQVMYYIFNNIWYNYPVSTQELEAGYKNIMLSDKPEYLNLKR